MRAVKGEIVHRVDGNGFDGKDVIARVHDDPTIVDFVSGAAAVRFAATKEPGTWHWACGKNVVGA